LTVCTDNKPPMFIMSVQATNHQCYNVCKTNTVPWSTDSHAKVGMSSPFPLPPDFQSVIGEILREISVTCNSVGEITSKNCGLQHASRPYGSVSEPSPGLFSKIHTSDTQILRTISLTSSFAGGNYVQELWSAACQSALRKCLWIKSYSVLSEIPPSYIHIRKTYYMWRGERELIPLWPKSCKPMGPAGSSESHQ
jgi:hypothetical protein